MYVKSNRFLSSALQTRVYTGIKWCDKYQILVMWYVNWQCDTCGPGSSVGITTGCRLDDPGIEFRWGRDFPHLSRPALGPPSLLYNGYLVFPGGKERPGRDADPSPLLIPWSWKGRGYNSTPPVGRTACTEPHCLYKGALYLTMYYVLKFQAKLLTDGCINPSWNQTQIKVLVTLSVPYASRFKLSSLLDFCARRDTFLYMNL